MIKTVLAPNAPWPKPDEKLVKRFAKKFVKRIKIESANLDYFLDAHEQLKASPKHSNRDKSGRFKSN